MVPERSKWNLLPRNTLPYRGTMAEAGTSNGTIPTRPRAGQLDGIRAFCVMAVIFSHTIPPEYQIGAYSFYEFGNYGVCMFFVLSGFLITGQLLETQERRGRSGQPAGELLATFYAKRMLRLFPAYYLAILGAALIGLPGIRAELPWHMAQLSDILFALDPVADNSSAAEHMWSLTVEWQFYLLWPFVILLLPARLLPWAIGLVVAASAIGVSPFVELPAVLDRTNILQSIGPLGIGAGLAWMGHARVPLAWVGRAGWPAAGLFALMVAALMTGHGRTGEALYLPGYAGLNIAFAAIVLAAARGSAGPAGALLDIPALRYLGRISYGIYVYHMFLLAMAERTMDRAGWGELPWGWRMSVMLFLASTAAAALSWHGMERPINDLRHRIGRRHGLAPALAPGA